MDHARAGDTHVDDPLSLPHAVEGASHERVVLHGVAEHHQLSAAKAASVGGALRRSLDGLAHEAHRVHVDARLGGANVDAGAHHVGDRQGLRDSGNELLVPLGHPFLHQGGEAADEVDPHRLGCLVHGLGKGDVVVGAGSARHQGHRGDGDTLVHDGDTELRLDIMAGLDQVLGGSSDLVIDLPASSCRVRVAAVQQRNAHSDGTHVQVLLVDHVDGT